MKKYNKKVIFWNFVYIAILVSIVGLIYVSSKRIEYIWRWQKVPGYILSINNDEFRARANGVVVIEGNRIYIEKADGERLLTAETGDAVVTNGATVIVGDLVAKDVSWRLGPLTLGLIMTIQISIVSIFFAIFIGLVTGMMRISSNIALKKLAVTYIEIVRGTPLIVQIFIMYFFFGKILFMEPFVAGVASLSLFTGAYIAEIVRAGIQSIPRGQAEAAKSLGFNHYQTMRYIILPQAIKRTLPPMAGQFISLIKDSSLVSVIAITDLTKAGREVISSTQSPFEVWFAVALMYLILTSALSYIISRFELKLSMSD